MNLVQSLLFPLYLEPYAVISVVLQGEDSITSKTIEYPVNTLDFVAIKDLKSAGSPTRIREDV